MTSGRCSVGCWRIPPRVAVSSRPPATTPRPGAWPRRRLGRSSTTVRPGRRGDPAMTHAGRRMFLMAVLVYAAFWNPRLDASMAWNFLDAGVSFVDTGRWMMAHSELYERVDTAAAAGGLVTGEPPGMAVL